MGYGKKRRTRRRSSGASTRWIELSAGVACVAAAIAIAWAAAPSVEKLARTMGGSSSVASTALDYCADTVEATNQRSRMLYTDARYMEQRPAAASEGEGPIRWCVIGTTYPSEVWWVIVRVGEENALYRTMLAENGPEDEATRAVITYQGLPPISFARDGWLGFITPGDDVWTEFRAGAGAELLLSIAEDSRGK